MSRFGVRPGHQALHARKSESVLDAGRTRVAGVICISVNDAFVMNEWQKHEKAFNITFLPGGYGDFSRGMGMLLTKNDLSFGKRSWRYFVLVKDGIIKKIPIEPDAPGDPFEVSHADTTLTYVAPDATAPQDSTSPMRNRPRGIHTSSNENGLLMMRVRASCSSNAVSA